VGIASIVNGYYPKAALDRWEAEALQTAAVTGRGVCRPSGMPGHYGPAHAQGFVPFEREGPPGNRSFGNYLETPLLGIERHRETQRRCRPTSSRQCFALASLRLSRMTNFGRSRMQPGRNQRLLAMVILVVVLFVKQNDLGRGKIHTGHPSQDMNGKPRGNHPADTHLGPISRLMGDPAACAPLPVPALPAPGEFVTPPVRQPAAKNGATRDLGQAAADRGDRSGLARQAAGRRIPVRQ
jgi:hypothetical protein